MLFNWSEVQAKLDAYISLLSSTGSFQCICLLQWFMSNEIDLCRIPLSDLCITHYDNQNLSKRKGRPIQLPIQKRNRILQTCTSEHPPSKLLAHMPVTTSRGRCWYCSTKSSPVFSIVKCSFLWRLPLCKTKRRTVFVISSNMRVRLEINKRYNLSF